jgi:hypothetical protein
MGRNRQRLFSGGSVCFGVVAMVLIVVVAGAAVEVVVRAEVVRALVTTGSALCWLLEQAPSIRATPPTVMALRKMCR